MREQVKVTDGDWFVEYNWRYCIRQAIRVTAQMVFYMGGSKLERVRLDKVVFSHRDERIAKLVADQLTSSMALCEDERRNASLRKIERDKNIIANAYRQWRSIHVKMKAPSAPNIA